MLVKVMFNFEGLRKGEVFDFDPADATNKRLMAFVRMGALRPVDPTPQDSEAVLADVALEEAKPKKRVRKVLVPKATPLLPPEPEIDPAMFEEHDN